MWGHGERLVLHAWDRGGPPPSRAWATVSCRRRAPGAAATIVGGATCLREESRRRRVTRRAWSRGRAGGSIGLPGTLPMRRCGRSPVRAASSLRWCFTSSPPCPPAVSAPDRGCCPPTCASRRMHAEDAPPISCLRAASRACSSCRRGRLPPCGAASMLRRRRGCPLVRATRSRREPRSTTYALDLEQRRIRSRGDGEAAAPVAVTSRGNGEGAEARGRHNTGGERIRDGTRPCRFPGARPHPE